MPVACRSKVVLHWLEAWRYGTSSSSSFSSSGIRLAKSHQLKKMMMVQVASTLSLHTLVETRIVDAGLHHALVEGGGSKLYFGDENSEIDLRLDSSSSAHVRRFFLEGFA
jgi:hypothetical protein